MQSLLASVIASPLVATAVSTCSSYGKSVSCDMFFSQFGILFIPIIIVSIAIAVITIIANWIIFQKAGRPGWASIVPIYNMVVTFQIIGLNPWLILLFLVPFVNSIVGIIFSIIIAYRLAICFGKSTGFAVGIFFLPFIFYTMLAFSDDKYRPYEPQDSSTPPQTPPTTPVGPTTPTPPVPPVAM
jgi:hypothetical protein